MSSENTAIHVENLCKRYEIYSNPRDRLKQFILPRLERATGRAVKNYYEEFWALRDVSFDIKKGDTVGIIGRNGSGKSTLLQLICGTLTPTSGKIITNGRIAALLELGSGFNPEFTGRENVYLNAALLGLTREEINDRFDKIAAFADIGQFIEQPVKTYSSGMYVRLAFSVIAHVDADILVVDEALSVGDAVFNQKCMRFIRSFQEQGTLLFVSHEMGAVQNLCKSAIWLGKGQIQKMGQSKDVAKSYLHYTLQEIYGDKVKLDKNKEIHENGQDESAQGEFLLDYQSEYAVRDNMSESTGWKTGQCEIVSIELKPENSMNTGVFEGGETVCMKIHARAIDVINKPILGFLFRDRLGQDIFGENTLSFTSLKPINVEAGCEFIGEFIFKLPMLPNGEYVVMASVADGDQYENIQHHYMHDAYVVNVSSSKVRYGLVGVSFQKVSLELVDVQNQIK